MDVIQEEEVEIRIGGDEGGIHVEEIMMNENYHSPMATTLPRNHTTEMLPMTMMLLKWLTC